MIQSFSFSRTGQRHLDMARPNEDFAVAAAGENLGVIALCDGAGSKPAGSLAARTTAAFLSEYLAAHFEELYSAPAADSRKQLACQVEMLLTGVSREAAVPPEDLACTILAAALSGDGRCFCLHLGDGILLRQRSAGESPEVVSSPRNGLAANRTFLTMNCSLEDNLRVYRWEDRELQGLTAMTDGAMHALVPGLRPTGSDFGPYRTMGADTLEALLAERAPEDDYTVAGLRRTEQRPA